MSTNLICIGSGSAGNAYIIKDGDNKLLLECGINTKVIMKYLDYDIRNLNCLVTHRHKDHCKYIQGILSHGINVYSNSDVANIYKGVTPLQEEKRYNIGAFKVMPLRVPHGDTLNCAYVIDGIAIGRVVFITDASDFAYTIPRVNTLMIEANYSDELLLKAITEKSVRGSSEYHLNITTTENVINRHYTPDLRRVVLLHLSDAYSDERAFVAQIRNSFPTIEVYAAAEGRKFDLTASYF